MRFTGERLVSGIPRLENMIVEELARLNFVQSTKGLKNRQKCNK